MASTIEHTIGTDAWEKIAEGVANVGLQLSVLGRVRIHIGESTPASNAAGITMGNTTKELPQTFSVSGLPLTSAVYAISMEEHDMKVVVLSY